MPSKYRVTTDQGVFDVTVDDGASAPAATRGTGSGGASTALLTAGEVAPLAARTAMEVATNPALPKIGSTVGQIVGGVEGLLHGGPLAAAGGTWTGSKAGWFTGKLAQKLAAPVAAMAEKAAPYAQTLSTLGAVAGVGDLAQIADPNRKDIGFLGISNKGTPDPEHPALINEAIAQLADRMGRHDIAAKWRGQGR